MSPQCRVAAMQVTAIDLGGTHVRFAEAEVADGRVVRLGGPTKLRTADYASFVTAWQAYAGQLEAAPQAVAIAVASPIGGEVIKLTNNPWILRPALLCERLDVACYTLVNDFAAVGHAVAQLPEDAFRHLCGPDVDLPASGTISICGPGTGLGVAAIYREEDRYHILPTEGGHVDFAPLDAIEDRLLARLRAAHGRVSTERVVAGPALVDWYETLAQLEGRSIPRMDDKALWSLALEGADPLAVAAMERLCLSLGAVAGDLALAHGAATTVIAGGLGLRLQDHLARSGFATRYAAKGRFQSRMQALPVKLVTYPEPGLYGAAAAFAQEHAD